MALITYNPDAKFSQAQKPIHAQSSENTDDSAFSVKLENQFTLSQLQKTGTLPIAWQGMRGAGIHMPGFGALTSHAEIFTAVVAP